MGDAADDLIEQGELAWLLHYTKQCDEFCEYCGQYFGELDKALDQLDRSGKWRNLLMKRR